MLFYDVGNLSLCNHQLPKQKETVTDKSVEIYHFVQFDIIITTISIVYKTYICHKKFCGHQMPVLHDTDTGSVKNSHTSTYNTIKVFLSDLPQIW